MLLGTIKMVEIATFRDDSFIIALRFFYVVPPPPPALSVLCLLLLLQSSLIYKVSDIHKLLIIFI